MSNLLVEVTPSPVTILSEGKHGDGRMRIRATIMVAETVNKNNRLYRLPTVQREVARFAERIEKKMAFGSGGHPADGKTDWDSLGLIWDSVAMRGNAVIGEATVLRTPRGAAIAELLTVTNSIPVSVRGFGTVAPEIREGKTIDVVKDDWALETCDVVLGAPGFDDAAATVLRETREGRSTRAWTVAQQYQRRLAGVRDADDPPLLKLSWGQYHERRLAGLLIELEQLPDLPVRRNILFTEEEQARQRRAAGVQDEEVAAPPAALSEQQRRQQRAAGIPLTEELTFSDIEEAVRRAVQAKYGPGGDVPTLAHATGEAPYVVGVLSKKAIVRWNAKLWAIGYEMDDVGDAVLRGVPEQVTTAYLPVKGAATDEEHGETDLPPMTADQQRQRFLLGEQLIDTVAPPEEAAPPAVTEAARRAVQQSLGRGDLRDLNSPVEGATIAHMDGGSVTVMHAGKSWRVDYVVGESGITLRKPVASGPPRGAPKGQGARADAKALRYRLGV